MARVIVAAFVATFIAAIAAIAGVPVFAQNAPAAPPPPVVPTPGDATGAAGPEGMRARFAAMDTDHDGRISQAEWLAAGRHERGFAMMDADHDGFLTADELRAGMARMRAMRSARADAGTPPQ